MLTAIVSLVTFLYLLATSYVVIQQNPKRPVNISLGLGVFIAGLWLIGVAGLTTFLGGNIWYGRAVFAAGLTSVLMLALFVLYFAESEKKRIRHFNTRIFLGVGVVFFALTVGTSLILKGVQPGDANALPVPEMGIIYPFYVLWLLFLGVVIATQLIYVYRNSKGVLRNQAQVILLGLFLFAALGTTTNVILPELFNSTSPAKLTPVSAAILGFSLSYAIVRHSLFNIRLLVARSLAYILLISTLISIYTVLVFVLATKLLPENSILTQQVLPMVAALFVAATAPFFKRLFDKATNQIFYRDAYDPQAFLDELNKTLVSNIELGILLRRTAAVIQNNLKAESCFITVRQTDERPFRLLGTDAPKFNADHLQYIYNEMAEMEQKLLISDDVKLDHSRLKRTLTSGGIALVSAPTGYGKDNPALAYLILGPKKSGNIYSKDDLRLIQIITDELIIAVQNALRFEEIQSFNVTLQAKINEATEQLQRSNKKLQVLDQTKDEFISMASHQLRTPLTSVKGYLSMVLDGDAGDINEDQKKMLQQAFISSQRMTYLISDLLNVSRLKTGKFFIEKIPTNLAAVVQQEVDQLVESAKIRGLTLNYIRPDDFPMLEIDETKTRQVIMNFIDNAIYYTPPGGTVSIEIMNKPHSIELAVTDSGMGIPKKEQHKLFSKFFRAPNAKRARPDGTGLGLFMAKKIIVAQGGATIFHSQLGKGSTFGFTLPKKPKS